MAVDICGSNFGFDSRTHHFGHDAGNGVDGAVETRTSGGWLGHVRENVSQEIVSTSGAAGSRFGEVVGVAVNVEDHVTGGIPDSGIGVRAGVVDKPEGVGVGFLCDFCLL